MAIGRDAQSGRIPGVPITVATVTITTTGSVGEASSLITSGGRGFAQAISH